MCALEHVPVCVRERKKEGGEEGEVMFELDVAVLAARLAAG